MWRSRLNSRRVSLYFYFVHLSAPTRAWLVNQVHRAGWHRKAVMIAGVTGFHSSIEQYNLPRCKTLTSSQYRKEILTVCVHCEGSLRTLTSSPFFQRLHFSNLLLVLQNFFWFALFLTTNIRCIKPLRSKRPSGVLHETQPTSSSYHDAFQHQSSQTNPWLPHVILRVFPTQSYRSAGTSTRALAASRTPLLLPVTSPWPFG